MDDRSDPQFERLLGYLQEERGFDFGAYRREGLMRRVRRQMASVEVPAFDQYQDYLAVHPDECTALFDAVLVNVTSFFRDPDSWDHLRREVVPRLASRGHEPIRVWSAGCSTGQEAYSLAMLLTDALGPDEFRERVKIYATDVDENALTKARSATYTARELRGLDDSQVDAYLEETTDGHHTVGKDLRQAVVFGRNDLAQDAPMSHIDLLVCRNTLMYFNAEAQRRVVRRLHAALRPGGTLFLGKVDMLLSHADLFAPVDHERRFFRRTDDDVVPARRAPVETGAAADELARLREEALLSTPAAQIVVAATGELVASNRHAASLFGIATDDVGRPFQDLEVSYRPLELRSAIRTAIGERRSVWARDVEWQRPDHDPVSLDVEVAPLVGPAEEALGATVIFNDVTRTRHLQHELELANRQLEAAFQELQATNGELETTNEELQSTNEELETMNEELRSMNDELDASNEELHLRAVQVGERDDLMASVLSSLRAGVVVVDAGMSVLAWNAGAIDLWGLREDEAVGTDLADLDIGMPLATLLPVVRQVVAGAAATTTRVRAVNRRGRPVEVDVTVTALRRPAVGADGAIVVMMLVDG